MKTVVTGGAGFIGSNLARELIRTGHEVHVVDDLSTGHRANVPSEADFRQGSILDRTILDEVFAGAEVVFHQGAIGSVQRSVDDSLTTHEVNVTGTLNVLEAALEAGVGKVVAASSSSVYGDTPKLPKRESMTPTPMSPYAASKLACEAYCSAFWHVHGLRTTTLRYFNVFGPRQDPSGPYAAVIPAFVSAALAGRPLRIHGDGSYSRDFTFVSDVVRANILAGSSTRADGFAVNVSAESQTTIIALAEQIIELTDSSSALEFHDVRPGDVPHSLADLKRARTKLGFEPSVSLRDGLARTIAWYGESGMDQAGQGL